jgi:pseudouridine-5'-phosphate glycosidase
MEMTVKDNKFFMLLEKQGSKKEIRIYDEMNPAIAMIKGSLKKGVTSENIELLSIEIKEEKFEIKTIPWDVIATQLIKES